MYQQFVSSVPKYLLSVEKGDVNILLSHVAAQIQNEWILEKFST